MAKVEKKKRDGEPTGPGARRSFLDWYEYGFSGALEQAAKMDRPRAVDFLAREVATFAKCNPNYKAEARPDGTRFVECFTLYLVGRLDERREADPWPELSEDWDQMADDWPAADFGDLDAVDFGDWQDPGQ